MKLLQARPLLLRNNDNDCDRNQLERCGYRYRENINDLIKVRSEALRIRTIVKCNEKQMSRYFQFSGSVNIAVSKNDKMIYWQ